MSARRSKEAVMISREAKDLKLVVRLTLVCAVVVGVVYAVLKAIAH
jgi:flagellar biosynthesis protein FliQ